MDIFLMRHGRRPFTTGDVPLNDEGLLQARNLINEPRFQNIHTLLSSPKKRALMTLEPLSKHLDLSIQVEKNLDQHQSDETHEQFLSRVQKVISQLSEKKWTTPLLLCSHSDWLSTACQLLPTDELNLELHMFQTAEFLHFQIIEGLWKLKN